MSKSNEAPTLREISRKPIVTGKQPPISPWGGGDIDSGSFQRIADAMEETASNTGRIAKALETAASGVAFRGRYQKKCAEVRALKAEIELMKKGQSR